MEWRIERAVTGPGVGGRRRRREWGTTLERDDDDDVRAGAVRFSSITVVFDFVSVRLNLCFCFQAP